MNRKQFIESNGATCRNWTWSWSFINEKEKIIIFGAWDTETEGERTIIFSEDWQVLNGKKRNGYNQSREHIRLIEENGFQLKIYPVEAFDKKCKGGLAPAKIGDFQPKLSSKLLTREGRNWYAF